MIVKGENKNFDISCFPLDKKELNRLHLERFAVYGFGQQVLKNDFWFPLTSFLSPRGEDEK